MVIVLHSHGWFSLLLQVINHHIVRGSCFLLKADPLLFFYKYNHCLITILVKFLNLASVSTICLYICYPIKQFHNRKILELWHLH